MRVLDLESEVFPPTGTIAAEGARKTLGRPRLDPLTVLVRETAQNSGDARREGCPTILMRFETRELTATQSAFLRGNLLSQRPRMAELDALLKSTKPIRILSVSDHGTLGLGGPSRA